MLVNPAMDPDNNVTFEFIVRDIKEHHNVNWHF